VLGAKYMHIDREGFLIGRGRRRSCQIMCHETKNIA